MRASTSASRLQAVVAERVMTPAVDSGLVATAADDGVAAMTTTSRLRAVVAERVQALLRRKQELLAARKKLSSHMSLYRKGILKGNPSASSKRFGEALKELRDMLNIK